MYSTRYQKQQSTIKQKELNFILAQWLLLFLPVHKLIFFLKISFFFAKQNSEFKEIRSIFFSSVSPLSFTYLLMFYVFLLPVHGSYATQKYKELNCAFLPFSFSFCNWLLVVRLMSIKFNVPSWNDIYTILMISFKYIFFPYS